MFFVISFSDKSAFACERTWTVANCSPSAQGQELTCTYMHPSPQLLHAVLLHCLHYGVNALHEARGGEIFWQGQQQRHQMLVHTCLVPWVTSLCHIQDSCGSSDNPPLPQRLEADKDHRHVKVTV